MAYDLRNVTPFFQHMGRHYCGAIEETVLDLEEIGVPYALFGGVGARVLGTRRQCDGLDFFVSSYEILRAHQERPDVFGEPYKGEVYGIKVKLSDVGYGPDRLPVKLVADPLVDERYQFIFDRGMEDQALELPFKGGLTVPVLSPEDLILFKLASGRGLIEGKFDLFDAGGVLEVWRDGLDIDYMRERAGNVGIGDFSRYERALLEDVDLENSFQREVPNDRYDPTNDLTRYHPELVHFGRHQLKLLREVTCLLDEVGIRYMVTAGLAALYYRNRFADNSYGYPDSLDSYNQREDIDIIAGGEDPVDNLHDEIRESLGERIVQPPEDVNKGPHIRARTMIIDGGPITFAEIFQDITVQGQDYQPDWDKTVKIPLLNGESGQLYVTFQGARDLAQFRRMTGRDLDVGKFDIEDARFLSGLNY